MFPQYRPVRPDDFEECFRSTRNGFAFADPDSRSALLDLWRTLLADGRMIGAVIEDALALQGERIVWHCFKVFVTDGFAAALRAGELPPISSRQLLEIYRRGEALPVLSLAEVRYANSHPEMGGGLNMLVTHYGSPFVLGEGKGATVANHLLGFTEYFSSGYNAQEILEEFYDDFNDRVARNAGFCPRNDYAGYYKDRPAPLPDRRPRLLGTNREEARDRPGTIAATIFCYEKPQFFFRPGEQELLLHALLGDSDALLAERLSLAQITIRKRWESIYERVNAIAPDVLGERNRLGNEKAASRASARDEAGRRPEKKRRLLAYLRHHMEELRPVEIAHGIAVCAPKHYDTAREIVRA